jgi:iron complex transport system ATP-binding protein
MTALLDARGIGIGGRLEPSDLKSEPGELVAIIGPNGAGKTSLLRALAGIERDSGRVFIDGESVDDAPPARRMRLVSFLPATRSLVWPIIVRDVVGLGLPSPDPARVEEMIELLELRSMAARPANRLSTGERSRALFARALAARPRLLLLDEPLSNLDPYWVLRTIQILRAEAEANECAVLVCVHDLSQVAAFDRVLLIENGRITASGSPEKIIQSADLERAFRIERAGSGWRIGAEAKPMADLRSSQ